MKIRDQEGDRSLMLMVFATVTLLADKTTCTKA